MSRPSPPDSPEPGAALPKGRAQGATCAEPGLLDGNLVGKDLSGANLFQVDLEAADLLGANLAGANLVRANLTRAGLGGSNLAGAEAPGANLSETSLNGAQMHGVNLQSARLNGARLCGANLHGADLSRADLRGANLKDADVRDASFDGALLEGALLQGIKGFERASWLDIDFHKVDFSGAHMLRSFVLDQNYLHEFRNKSRWHGFLYLLWLVTSDCGRSPLRWATLTISLVVGFAFLLNSVPVDYGSYPTPLSPLYMSVVTITTLGYGDAVPMSTAAQVVVMAEVVTGYLLLGGLLSLFSNQMARRAE